MTSGPGSTPEHPAYGADARQLEGWAAVPACAAPRLRRMLLSPFGCARWHQAQCLADFNWALEARDLTADSSVCQRRPMDNGLALGKVSPAESR